MANKQKPLWKEGYKPFLRHSKALAYKAELEKDPNYSNVSMETGIFSPHIVYFHKRTKSGKKLLNEK